MRDYMLLGCGSLNYSKQMVIQRLPLNDHHPRLKSPHCADVAKQKHGLLQVHVFNELDREAKFAS